MKPVENTEKFVRESKPQMTSDSRLDMRILTDSYDAMDKAVEAASAARRGTAGWSRTVRFAAAAAVLIAVSVLLVVNMVPDYGQPGRTVEHVEESPAEMMSMLSLMTAYRRGGVEEVDRQSEKAFEMLGWKSEAVSINELLSESNGV